MGANRMDTAFIRREAVGVVLIICKLFLINAFCLRTHFFFLNIATWNYPLQLSLVPLAGALAAGNCIVLKVHTSFSSLIKKTKSASVLSVPARTSSMDKLSHS